MRYTFEEKTTGGFKDQLYVRRDGYFICSFSFNMKGYVPNFELKNCDGVLVHFGESNANVQIKKLERFINQGFNIIHPFL